MPTTEQIAGIIGAVAGAIGLWKALFAPLKELKVEQAALKTRLDIVDEFNRTAQQARAEIRQDQRDLSARIDENHRLIEKINLWIAGVEEIKIASFKERAEIKEDIAYLEGQVDKLRDEKLLK